MFTLPNLILWRLVQHYPPPTASPREGWVFLGSQKMLKYEGKCDIQLDGREDFRHQVEGISASSKEEKRQRAG